MKTEAPLVLLLFWVRRHRANPKTVLIFVFHPYFQDLQSILRGPGFDYSVAYSVVCSVALTALLFPSGSVWWSGYQAGSDRETWRYLIRSQSSLHFSPVILTWQAYPSCCRLVMVCALGDHITLKSFTGLLVCRSSVNAWIGALCFSFGSHKGNKLSYLSLVLVFKCRYVNLIFCYCCFYQV